jgi:hypothetical protein
VAVWKVEAKSMQQGELREAMSRVDQQIAELARRGAIDAGGNVEELATAWKALVRILAVPEAPRVRNCPSCQKAVMSAATVCGFCWTALVPEGPVTR